MGASNDEGKGGAAWVLRKSENGQRRRTATMVLSRCEVCGISKGLYSTVWSSLNSGWAASVLAAPGLMGERVRAQARVWSQGSMAGRGGSR
ncbi:hypothetical protein M0R45_008789 [Rubus argutus]|uniref:Uncharacterized protein n=1 Tax=Rubus argutus TaxID=59490 RepID=A0AAW1Y1R3_RUBAR